MCAQSLFWLSYSPSSVYLGKIARRADLGPNFLDLSHQGNRMSQKVRELFCREFFLKKKVAGRVAFLVELEPASERNGWRSARRRRAVRQSISRAVSALNPA